MKNMKEKLSAKLKKKNGFTLIEMLVVVAIIVILVLVSIPMVTSSLDKARKATDEANLRAAKAVATIEALSSDNPQSISGQWYDITTGELTTSQPAGYGEVSTNKGNAIQVTVTKDATTEKTTIKCEWKAGKSQ